MAKNHLSPRAAYFRELTTRYRPSLITLLLAATVIGTLVGSLCYIHFAQQGGEDFKTGMVYASVIAVFPTIVGVKMSFQHFFRDQRDLLAHLLRLGVSPGRVRWWTLQIGVVASVVAAIAGTVFGRIILEPLMWLFFLGVPIEMPGQWGTWWKVLLASLVVTFLLYIGGCWQAGRQLPRLLELRPVKAVRAHAWRSGFLIAALALVNVALGVLFLLGIGQGLALVTFACTVPFLAAYIAPFLTKNGSRALSTLLSKKCGWNAFTLGLRSTTKAGTSQVAALIALMVAIPLAAFTWADVTNYAAREYAAESFRDQPIVVREDSALLSPSAAEEICAQAGDSCAGIAWWQGSNFWETGNAPVPIETASDWSLSFSTPQARDLVLSGQETPRYARSFFGMESIALYQAVAEEVADPQYGFVVLSGTDGLPETLVNGAQVTAANSWVWDSDEDLYYGPHGDGTRSFIPLFAYTLLAISVILALNVAGRKRTLAEFFHPVTYVGGSDRMQRVAATWSVLVPYAFSTLAAFLAAFWYSQVGQFDITHSLRLLLPTLPAGLMILFLIVFLVSGCMPLLSRKREAKSGQI